MYFKVTRHLYNFLWYFQLAQLMANIKLYWNSLIQSRKELCIMLIQSHWNKLYKNRRLLSHSLEKNIKILLSFYFLVVFFLFSWGFWFVYLFLCFFRNSARRSSFTQKAFGVNQVGFGLKFAYLLLRFLSFQIFIIFYFLHVRTNPTPE